MDWKTVKKIDAHVHLVPPETLDWIDGVWKQADPTIYLELMEKYHVEKALLVPINEGATYYRDCSRTNQWLGSMADRSNGKFIAFADVLPIGGYFYDTAPYSLEQAVTEYGLKGLKLHPSNLGIPIDSLEMVPVVRKAINFPFERSAILPSH